jgi:ABC-type dipeptide/oligopeptide/nickel transport system ATPase subunit
MICYIVRGLSGSGKSTLAQALAFGAGIESRPRDYNGWRIEREK